MSQRTASFRNKYILFKLLSLCVTVLPLLVYVFIGFFNGQVEKAQKITLSFSCMMALMLVFVNIIFKYKLRSPLFILLLGVYSALRNILPLILMLSVGVILDEFIFTPAYMKAKNRLIINKEIDVRTE